MKTRLLYEALNDFLIKINNLKAMIKPHGLLAEETINDLEKKKLLITEIRDENIPQDQIREFQKSLLFMDQIDLFPTDYSF
ncbi:MAG: hypothetical protein RBR84_08460 [Bacteroidales bacterium]|jgi:hypothetical protein|nr:hypothetical protein [Bacteroidales bacterium]